MNEYELNDPSLRSLEAHLSALAPRLSGDEQRELLYQCAFAAGKSSVSRKARRWRNGCLLLVVLLGGTTASMVGRGSPSAPEHGRGNPIATPTGRTPAPAAVQSIVSGFVPTPAGIDVGLPTPRVPPVRLDAWAIRPDSDSNFSDAFGRFRQLDPASRANSVALMERQFLSRRTGL